MMNCRSYLTILLLFTLLTGCGAGSGGGDVRRAVVAGQFYPDDPVKLEAAIEAYFNDAEEPIVPRPTALIAPHAGYIYSGQIAADAWNQARGHDYDVIVILGTNHSAPTFQGISIYDRSGYETPLGVAKIDRGLVKELLSLDDRYTFRPELHEREHSVEVHVPFAQEALPGVPIVPVVIGKPDLELCRDFGQRLAIALEKRRALVVASTDLSHYPSYADAVAADRRFIESVLLLSPDSVQATVNRQMRRGVPGLSTCACGEGPVIAAMAASVSLEPGDAAKTRATLISYANSGDVPIGDRSRVVGYAAIALHHGENAPSGHAWRDPSVIPEAVSPIPETDRRELLEYARKTIERFLFTETIPLPRGFNQALYAHRGAFVTLEKNGRLRGCIGHMREDKPLVTVVGTMALQAAFRDRRFPPVREEEVDSLEIEISVLTPYRKVSGPEEIEIGRDGIMIKKGAKQAVYLPQVATEQGWTREQTLGNLCRKAGLPESAWKDKGMEFLTFQAEVFSETD